MLSAQSLIAVATEAKGNEFILNSSLSAFLSPFASLAADAVPVRKDGDQVKCYYLFLF